MAIQHVDLNPTGGGCPVAGPGTSQAFVTGNLGVAITSPLSAWSTSWKGVHLSGNTTLVNGYGVMSILAINVVENGGYKYAANGYACQYTQQNGSHQWQCAVNNNGGVGANISWLPDLQFSSTGLAINPTTASSSTTTGALIVAGGAGIAGALYAGSVYSGGVALANYTHPTTTGNKHVPSGGATGNVLTWASDGTASWAAPSGGGGTTTNAVTFTTTGGAAAGTTFDGSVARIIDYSTIGACPVAGPGTSQAFTTGTLVVGGDSGFGAKLGISAGSNTLGVSITSGNSTGVNSILINDLHSGSNRHGVFGVINAVDTWGLGYTTGGGTLFTPAITWNNTTGVAVLGGIASSGTTSGTLVVTGGMGVSGDIWTTNIYATSTMAVAGTTPGFMFNASTNDANSGVISFLKSNAATAVVTGKVLGAVYFNGQTGLASTATGFSLQAIVNGTVTIGTVPTDLVFNSGATEVLRIKAGGDLTIPTASGVQDRYINIGVSDKIKLKAHTDTVTASNTSFTFQVYNGAAYIDSLKVTTGGITVGDFSCTGSVTLNSLSLGNGTAALTLIMNGLGGAGVGTSIKLQKAGAWTTYIGHTSGWLAGANTSSNLALVTYSGLGLDFFVNGASTTAMNIASTGAVSMGSTLTTAGLITANVNSGSAVDGIIINGLHMGGNSGYLKWSDSYFQDGGGTRAAVIGAPGLDNNTGRLRFLIQTAASTLTNGMILFTTGLSIPLTTASSSTTTGALIVDGGVGIGGKLHVNDTINGFGHSYFLQGKMIQWTESGGGAGLHRASILVDSSAVMTINIGTDVFQAVNITTTTVSVPLNTVSTSTTTGAFKVTGGVGIGGDTYIGGNVVITGSISAGSGLGGLSYNGSVQSTGFTAAVNTSYFILGTITVTLPAGPAFNDIVEIKPVDGGIGATIARNSLLIMGLAEDMTVDTYYSTIRLQYTNTTYGWRVLT